MKSNTWPVGVLILLMAVTEAPAQYGGLSINYRRNTRHSSVSFSLRRPFYGYRGGPYFSVAPPYAFSGYTHVVVVSPPIILAPPPLLPLGPPLEDLILDPPPPPAQVGRLQIAPPDDLPLPGRDAGVFRPLEPDNRDRARQPVAPPKEQPKREPLPPIPERPLPPPPMKDNPAEEGLRQLEMGKEAFARGEYGRAAERFRQAVDLAPTNALAQVLLGQAHLALGNQRRAFDALLEGLRLDSTWPKQPFQPSQLYGEQVVDHAEHLRILEELQSMNPDDPVLLFVTGYQLWFDGRRDEAAALLLRAAPVLPDPNVVDRFLQALPNRDVL